MDVTEDYAKANLEYILDQLEPKSAAMGIAKQVLDGKPMTANQQRVWDIVIAPNVTCRMCGKHIEPFEFIGWHNNYYLCAGCS